MFLGGDELLRLVRELEAMGKAHMEARLAEMAAGEPKDDFEQFMHHLHEEKI